MQNQTTQKDILLLGTVYISFQPLLKCDGVLIQNGQVKTLLKMEEINQILNLDTFQEDLENKLKIEEYLEWETEHLKIIKLSKTQMAMPGIIDSHVHPQSGGIQLSRTRIQQNCSWEDAKEVIKKSIRKGDHDKKDWVFVYGYSQGWFKEKSQSIQDLDEISPNKPLIIMRDDCHAYWCNSKILEITNSKQEKGIFIEEQMNIVRKHIPKLDEEEQQYCLLKGINHLVENGIVAFQDAAVKERLFYNYKKLYQRADVYDSLPYCCMSICWNDLFLEQTQSINQRQLDFDEEVKFETVENSIMQIQQLSLDKLYCHSVKIFVDGVVESKTALMNVTYCKCGHNGQLMLQNIPQILEGLNDRAIQAHIHSMGDGATDLVVDSYERIQHKLNKNTINYLAHLEFVSPKAIELFKKFNLGANFSPLWFYENPEYSLVPTSLPSQYLESMYPIKELQPCVIGFGSDWPVSSPNPFYAIEAAVTRQPLGHSQAPIPIGDLKQRVSVEQAMHYYTEGSAQLIQKPGLGIIKEGQSANLIIISKNVFEVKPYEIHETKVLQTFIKGQRIYKA